MDDDERCGPSVMGIHLGTNYSSVGVWVHGAAEIALNNLGNKTTASYVAFTKEERLVGDAAFNLIFLNPTNTIFEVEHLMGRKFDDETVQRKVNGWPFKVVAGSNGRPLVVVQYKGEEKLFAAEEISSMILSHMHQIAQTYCKCSITNAVITCPAYFNDSQRRATRDAGVIAGINVLRILSEPSAVATAYGFHNMSQGNREKMNILIFDLGARTLDVSLVTIKNGNVEVKATARDTHLGEDYFVDNMINHCVSEFKRKNHVDISNIPRSTRRLRYHCEKAKRGLSSSMTSFIDLESLNDGIDFQTIITRAKFETLNEDLLLKCLDPLKRCLEDAKMSNSDVHEVVLNGGSTQIPMIQELVQDFFHGKKLNYSIDPNEVVALGATINAAMMVGDMSELVLVDVTPLSLGIEIKGGLMSVVIPRNTPFPTTKEIFVTIAKANQTSTAYDIYEGERTIARENNLLGSFRLSGIAPSPAFVPRIRVTFRIDADGILNVSALDMENLRSAELTVTNEQGRLREEEIDRMIEDGRRYKKEDEQKKNQATAKNELEKYVSCVKITLRDRYVATMITTDHKKRVESAVRETEEWLDVQDMETEASEYHRKRMELETIFKPFKAKFQITS